MSARARALLLVFILMGFGLRVFLLDGQSLWYDEGVTATIAQRDLVELTRWTANDIQPPLYYYAVAGWGRIAGWSEWALRYPSAVFGVLAIPLLAVLALRLARLRVAALLAALLAAAHPLLVYYGQEARMYTLLVLLGILAAYLLARTADRDPPGWPLWAEYVVIATAAIYSHYFAIFLLLGLGCAWLLDVAVRRRPTGPSLRATLAPFVVANAVVVVLYLPWLANLFTRLRVDRSYWTGTLKLHEALLDIALRFTSGETMSERFGIWLLLGYGVITLAAIYGLWRMWPQTRRLVIYTAFWLAAPILAVLLLAFNVPKFNARYVMLAAPALMLVWAVGLAGLGARWSAQHVTACPAASHTRQGRNVLAMPGSRWAAGLCVVLLVAGGLWSNWNWFFNHAYDKDHWRQITPSCATAWRRTSRSCW